MDNAKRMPTSYLDRDDDSRQAGSGALSVRLSGSPPEMPSDPPLLIVMRRLERGLNDLAEAHGVLATRLTPVFAGGSPAGLHEATQHGTAANPSAPPSIVVARIGDFAAAVEREVTRVHVMLQALDV